MVFFVFVFFGNLFVDYFLTKNIYECFEVPWLGKYLLSNVSLVAFFEGFALYNCNGENCNENAAV